MFKNFFYLIMLTLSTHLFSMQMLIKQDRSKKRIETSEDSEETQENIRENVNFINPHTNIESNASWNDLPREIKTLILGKIQSSQSIVRAYGDLVALKSVCKEFKEIIEQESTIKQLIHEYLAANPNNTYENCLDRIKYEERLLKTRNAKRTWESSDAGKRAKTQEIYRDLRYSKMTSKKQERDDQGLSINLGIVGTPSLAITLAMTIQSSDRSLEERLFLGTLSLPSTLSLLYPGLRTLSDILDLDKCARAAGDVKFRIALLKNILIAPLVTTTMAHFFGKLAKLRPDKLVALDTIVAIGSLTYGYVSSHMLLEKSKSNEKQ